MTYARPILIRCYRAGLLGSIGYAILAADGTTVIAARTTEGVAAGGPGEYRASPTFDTAWGRCVIVRWTTADGTTVDASEAIDQGDWQTAAQASADRQLLADRADAAIEAADAATQAGLDAEAAAQEGAAAATLAAARAEQARAAANAAVTAVESLDLPGGGNGGRTVKFEDRIVR